MIDKYFINNTIKIIVKANSNQNEIKDFDFNRKALKVNIKAKAEHNKANIELIKFFKRLGYDVKIVRGFKSKEKFLKVI